ncbi:MAG: sulfatase [Sporolactobacillus sp.]|nr:sulfatase [Sporolactobacillus sp.]
MISHDSGRYLGTYGQKIATPAIDRLANRGIKFDRYYCPAPQCSPSRGSILTGRYPHNNGLIGLAHKGFSINENITTLPKELVKAGYETTLIGFSHETIGHESLGTVSSTYQLGYERYEKVEGNLALTVAERAEAFLDEKASEGSKRPFFVNIGFEETHRPFDRYRACADKPEDIEPLPYLPDTKNVRQDIALFHGSVKTMDRAVGRILRKIEQTALSKNTLIIYTTDHGIPFPRAKGTLKDAGLETALIIYSPQLSGNGREINHLLCNIDLMPTLLELAGAQIPPHLDGQSFAPLLRGERQDTRQEFFCELTWHDAYHPMRGIRNETYKYVLNFVDGPKIYMPLDCHLSLSGQQVYRDYYVQGDPEELYDLTQDPLETVNLFHQRDYQNIVAELRKKVKEWMINTHDPLLKGPVKGIRSKKWAEEEKLGRTYQRDE